MSRWSTALLLSPLRHLRRRERFRCRRSPATGLQLGTTAPASASNARLHHCVMLGTRILLLPLSDRLSADGCDLAAAGARQPDFAKFERGPQCAALDRGGKSCTCFCHATPAGLTSTHAAKRGARPFILGERARNSTATTVEHGVTHTECAATRSSSRRSSETSAGAWRIFYCPLFLEGTVGIRCAGVSGEQVHRLNA